MLWQCFLFAQFSYIVKKPIFFIWVLSIPVKLFMEESDSITLNFGPFESILIELRFWEMYFSCEAIKSADSELWWKNSKSKGPFVVNYERFSSTVPLHQRVSFLFCLFWYCSDCLIKFVNEVRVLLWSFWHFCLLKRKWIK